ncbi:MAG: MotA/TolQ/ExbB proton channel family protein [Thiofilum sp.]|uniref:MotA/TolQ/ExbB proton channel family protein n=1 Tax=Thiofilum sp. TaxID=2212733 RepID=UPI0025CC9AE6|nr:MotA/TolQ/ExbB proton channel family protein [Thiofilum sp.]MBK8453275.1 MotA/TolQ/ExbB proton channel family protein [Thiofilum sp.]
MNLSTPYLSVLYWLWFMGLVGLGVYISWDLHVLQPMITTDTTRISIVILLLGLAGLLHGGYRAYFLARQQQALQTLNRAIPLHTYLQARSDPSTNETLLTEQLAEYLRGAHQTGWFINGMLIKLGLLGTVIGFVMMLTSLDGLQSLDINQLQTLMQQMTKGMGIALNTTIFGLIGSLILGIQYLALDRYADALLMHILQLPKTSGSH